MIKLKSVFLSLSVALSLTACGGGGDVSADVDSMTVLPSSFNWTANTDCSAPDGVVGAVSIHTINGGQPPFRLSSVVAGLEVGLVGPSNSFVEAPSNMLNSEGDLVLSGKDPKFAIRATLLCPSNVGVLVLDDFSEPFTVEITVSPSA